MSRAVAVVALFLVASPAHARGPTPTVPAPAKAPVAPTGKGVTKAATPPKSTTDAVVTPERVRSLERLARRLTRQAVLLRGLRKRRRIKTGVMTRTQILARMTERLGQQFTDAEIAVDEAVLKRLGLLPATMNYKRAVLDLYAEQVAGFYDPFAAKLYIAAWLPPRLQAMTMIHEICHALQDQHFSLKRFVRPMKNNSDRQLAHAAVVEGDCTGLMVEHMLAPTGQDLGALSGIADAVTSRSFGDADGKRLSQAPLFLRETVIFPYRAGLRFIQRVRSKYSWATVSRLFKRPPQSTEQLLHYEKYWKREAPVRVRVRALPALAAYEAIKTDTLGELQLSLYLRSAVERSAAERAAAGWGGDRLVAYRLRPPAPVAKDAASSPASPPAEAAAVPAKPPLIVHATAWDSEADAIEFVNGQRRVFRARLDEGKSTRPNTWVHRDAAGDEWSIERRGAYVVTLIGAPRDVRAALQDEVWQTWRIGRRTLARCAR